MEPDLAEFPCTNCTERVGVVHVECIKCEELRLCLECFSCGAELGEHLRTHPYRLRNTAGKCIFNEENSGNLTSNQSWQAAEELSLLDAVERYNLGNWEDVVKLVNPARTVKELRHHYDKFYIRGRIGQKTLQNLSRPVIHDHGAAGCSTSNGMSPEMKESVARINADDLTMLAYMPHRDDFEKEYNNDAETVISNLIVMQDDDELDKAVKLSLIDMYIRQVSERKRRKALIRDYNLVPQFFKQEKPQITLSSYRYAPKDMQRVKFEKDLREDLKKTSQLIPGNEFDQMINDILKEKALKLRIKELQELHQNGIMTLQGQLKTGNECVVGKNDSVNQTLRANSSCCIEEVLSPQEKELCKIASLQESDYLLLKISLLKEHLLKNNGVPLRRNDSAVKDNVIDFMKCSGWLPFF